MWPCSSAVKPVEQNSSVSVFFGPSSVKFPFAILICINGYLWSDVRSSWAYRFSRKLTLTIIVETFQCSKVTKWLVTLVSNKYSKSFLWCLLFSSLILSKNADILVHWQFGKANYNLPGSWFTFRLLRMLLKFCIFFSFPSFIDRSPQSPRKRFLYWWRSEVGNRSKLHDQKCLFFPWDTAI